MIAHIAALALAVTTAVSHVSAANVGTTNATCSASYDWAENSLGQSPCLVVAKLVASVACYDEDYNLDPLSPGGWYINGKRPPACMCNDVAYSLFSACGDCQGHIWLNWGGWTTNCTTKFHDYQGNIPTDTEIPAWSRLDVETSGNYDPAAAKRFALAAASASSVSTASSSSAIVTFSSASTISSVSDTATSLGASVTTGVTAGISKSSTAAPTSPTRTGTAAADHASATSEPDPQPNGSKTNVGAIAGGVVGGVVLLGLLAGLGFWLRNKHSRRPAVPPPAASPYTYPPENPHSPGPRMSEYGGATTPSIAGTYNQARPYNPSDPSTFPSSPPPRSDTIYSPSVNTAGTGIPAGAPYNSGNPFQTPLPTPAPPTQNFTMPQPYNQYGNQQGHGGHSGYTGAPEV